MKHYTVLLIYLDKNPSKYKLDNFLHFVLAASEEEAIAETIKVSKFPVRNLAKAQAVEIRAEVAPMNFEWDYILTNEFLVFKRSGLDKEAELKEALIGVLREFGMSDIANKLSS